MIESLRGEIAERFPGHAVVECHGVGYLVHVSATTLSELPERGACRLYTHYAVSVDVRSGQSEHRLYGFAQEGERRLFRQLITVQGVSSTLGLAILGARPAEDVRRAILLGEESLFRQVKGIGPKLAQRIVAELQNRLLQVEGEAPVPLAGGGNNTVRGEALSALLSLGLDRVKAEKAIQAVLGEHPTPPALEELIKLALKNL